VYVAPPSVAVVSPNGDGIDDAEALGYKVVRPSNVTVTLTGPDGTAAYQQTAQTQPGAYQVPFPPQATPPPPAPGQPPVLPSPTPAAPAEGRWTLTVSATDDQGLASTATRRFAVNSTLGYLQVEPKTLALPPGGRSLAIRWTQARGAQVKVVLETVDGTPLRTLAATRYEAGPQTTAWNGRLKSGKLATGGRYLIGVTATNELGSVALAAPLTVRRVAGSK
jgi:hypothetical protein